jgi:hypothetical protein
MKKYFIFIFFSINYQLSTINYLTAQERLGISNSVYAGINGVWINPSNIAGSPFKIDINIVTAHTFIDNNYDYLYKANLPVLLKNYKSVINSYNEYNVSHAFMSKIMVYDKYNSADKNVYQSLLLQGPSVLLSYKDWGFAFITGFRQGLSAINVAPKLAKVAFEGMTYHTLSRQYIDIPDFRINSAAWMELGLSAARIIKLKKDKILKAGITFKYLLGFSGAYIHNKSSVIYYPNDNDMDFYFVNADYGHAIPPSKPEIVGSGQSVDLGITFMKFFVPKLKEFHQYYYKEGEGCRNDCNPNPWLLYKWKLGFSLLDIGYIRFNRDAKTYVFTDASSAWYNFAHWSPGSLDNFDRDLNAHFSPASSLRPQASSFISLMPMAACATYDLQLLTSGFYLNSTIIQRLPHFNTPGIDRENSLSLTPHYDYTHFGAALPFILYQYKYPRIGLCFRFGNNLIIGTDKLGCFLNNKLTGMDLYFSLKINIINKCN